MTPTAMPTPPPDYAPTPSPDVAPVVVVVAPPGLSDELRTYLMTRRDTLIQELRALDRALGRPQTVPVRER